MSNALTTRGTTALATQADIDPFADAADDMGASAGTYLKFNGNTGEYTYGKDGEELPEGTQLAVNMDSFRRGFICWVDEAVVDEVLVKVIDGRPPAKHDLQDHGPYKPAAPNETQDGWAEQAAVDFKALTDGAAFTFKTSSKSGLRSLGELLKSYAKQYKYHAGKIAIVSLETSSWMPKEKKHGKKYSPVFKIVDFKDAEELEALVEGSDNPEDYDGAEPEAPVEPAKEERKAAPAANARRRF